MPDVTVEFFQDGTYKFSGCKGARNVTKLKNETLEKYGKCIHNYGVVLELIPEDKTSALNQQIGNARFIKNKYLTDRRDYYTKNKKTLSVSEYKKNYIPALKAKNAFLERSDKFAIENALENVDAAFTRFFNKVSGYPKFASANKPGGNSYTTNITGNNIELTMHDNHPCIKLPKVGYVKIVLPKHRKLTDFTDSALIKKATVSKKGNTYRVSLGMETVIDKPTFPKEINVRDVMAVDLGIKDFGVFGNLEEFNRVPNPRWIQVHERRLRRLQKLMSRKQYNKVTHRGSKNWNKAKLRVAREQKKIADQRKDFNHKLSRAIADNCEAFVCEDLNIKGMMQNRRLSKSIASVGWYTFLTMIKYKMELLGKRFIKIGRFVASSQICGKCGYKNPAVKDLKVRKWDCPHCGTHHDRDVNAMHNIFNEGINLLKEQKVTVSTT